MKYPSSLASVAVSELECTLSRITVGAMGFNVPGFARPCMVTGFCGP